MGIKSPGKDDGSGIVPKGPVPGSPFGVIENLVLLVAFNDHYDSSEGVDTVYPAYGRARRRWR